MEKTFTAAEAAIILEALDHEANQENFNQAEVLAVTEKVKAISATEAPINRSGRTYSNQFDLDKYPCTIPAFLLKAPWEDTSWGNDACPSFTHNELHLAVYVDFDDPEDREWESGSKFSILHLGPDGDVLQDVPCENFNTEAELVEWLDQQLTKEDLEVIDELCTVHAPNDLGQAIGDAAKALTQAVRASKKLGFDTCTLRLEEAVSRINIILNYDTFHCSHCGTLGFDQYAVTTERGKFCTKSCEALSTDR